MTPDMARDQSRRAAAEFNNGMQLTKAARCAPFAFRSWGQSLKAAFAAEARCCADADWREMSEETMPLVGRPHSRSIQARGPVQRGSKRVAPRRKGSAFSAQPAAPCSAGFSLR